MCAAHLRRSSNDKVIESTRSSARDPNCSLSTSGSAEASRQVRRPSAISHMGRCSLPPLFTPCATTQPPAGVFLTAPTPACCDVDIEPASDRGSVQRRPTDRPTALCVTIILELDAPQGHSRRTTHQLTLPRPPRPFSTTPMQRIWGIRCDRAYS